MWIHIIFEFTFIIFSQGKGLLFQPVKSIHQLMKWSNRFSLSNLFLTYIDTEIKTILKYQRYPRIENLLRKQVVKTILISLYCLQALLCLSTPLSWRKEDPPYKSHFKQHFLHPLGGSFSSSVWNNFLSSTAEIIFNNTQLSYMIQCLLQCCLIIKDIIFYAFL